MFKIKTNTGQAENHILRMKVRGPDGKPRSNYYKNIMAENGVAAFEIPVALNDPKGCWIGEAQDVISGRKAYGYFYVR